MPFALREALAVLTALAVWFTASPAAARALPVVKPVMECSALGGTDVAPPGEAPARIVTARLVTTGTVGPYCEIKGYVAPQVRFELRLPTQNWMQRLMFSGCGGFCGRVDFRVRAADGCVAVENGEFALVASDLGHDAPDGNADTVWAAGSRQGKIDYGYRAVHVVTVAAKAIVQRFYGRPQAYAYFNGCSDGGREALMEVQRYPTDFNGVIAGASVIHDTTNNSIFHGWNALHAERADGSLMFAPSDLALLHKAALSACDMVGDGVVDGVIGDPEHCRFDPVSLQCGADRHTGCLTPEQAIAARAIYEGPRNRAGQALYFGRPVGSELAWGGPEVAQYSLAFIRHMAADQPQEFELRQMGFEPEDLARYDAEAPVYNATDPDIRAFARAGGKLIMWHGWADPGVPPMSSVAYYREARRALGGNADEIVRLFMLPGVGHCGGGDGPDKLDLVDPIMAWVEDGIAPQSVQVALKSFGRTVETRPVYPYPSVARYSGKGDTRSAASFSPAVR